MELKDLTRPLLRWWRLLLASTLIAGLTSFIVASQEPRLYEAFTTLMIGQAINEPNPSGGEFQLSQQLAGIYADIAERDPVAFATMDALGIDWLPDYNAHALPNSQFLEIEVVDTNPEVAQTVANELAYQLILQSPTAPDQEGQARQEFIAGQLDYLEEKIRETQDEIATKQTGLAELVSARQIADTQTAITALQSKLTSLQANYAALLSNTTGGATNTLSVIEYASLPTRPVAPDVPMITLLAAAVGFALAAAGAYLIEYLDDTIRTPDDVARIAQLPVIAHIPEAKELRLYGANPQLFSTLPSSHLAESIRTLRTNLEFVGPQGLPRSIMVCSPAEGNGALTVATQLAAALAHAGKRVSLIDASMRSPRLHQFLRIPNKLGLANMLQEDLVPQVVAQDSAVWRLKYITAGEATENAAELIGSVWLLKALARLREQFDVSIFVAPPFLMPESILLASRLESMVLVIRPGRTRENLVKQIVEQLERTHANLVGVVMNGLPARRTLPVTGFILYGLDLASGNGRVSKPAPAQSRGPVVIRRGAPDSKEAPPFKSD